MTTSGLKFDVKRKLMGKSDRVKCVDVHPSEPWILAALYNGIVYIWNYETQAISKTFEVCDLPVRAAKFVARKNWLITGSDDLYMRVFNYNTHERVAEVEAHLDYIRSISVHPNRPFVLSCADDFTIKLWDWEKNWSLVKVFEGHFHYVMAIAFNPKDNNTFASGSLDRTVKVWNLGSSTPNFTLDAHEKGINCIDYYPGPDKPYLASGSDDKTIKIWDYQNKSCIHTIVGHEHNISALAFHSSLPLLISGSEDATIRVTNLNNFRWVARYEYGLDRCWSISHLKGTNLIAYGFDGGSILVQMGKNEPSISMDAAGKMIWAKNTEILTANVKISGGRDVVDGEKLILPSKELGQCEIFPQSLRHSPSGRFVAVIGDGEYIIYTALAWRNKTFGKALDFAWSSDSNFYAILESTSKISVFKNFNSIGTFNESASTIYGGVLLSYLWNGLLYFRTWDENSYFVRRIAVTPKHVIWSDVGNLVAIATGECFFVLKYHPEAVTAYVEQGLEIPIDGIEEAFEVVAEIPEIVSSGTWIGECFLFTNAQNRLDYYIGGQVYVLSHMDGAFYLLGYLPKNGRAYLSDKDVNVVSYELSLNVVEYQMAILRGDIAESQSFLPHIPVDQLPNMAKFLESHGYKEEALSITTDPEHKFMLALELGKLDVAVSIAKEQESQEKWQQLAEIALQSCNSSLALEALERAENLSDLLLFCHARGYRKPLAALAKRATDTLKFNLAFLAYHLLGDREGCLQILLSCKKYPEAAFFTRTYLPGETPRVVELWKKFISERRNNTINYADLIADPVRNAEFFDNLGGGKEDPYSEYATQNVPSSPSQTHHHDLVRLNDHYEQDERGFHVSSSIEGRYVNGTVEHGTSKSKLTGSLKKNPTDMKQREEVNTDEDAHYGDAYDNEDEIGGQDTFDAQSHISMEVNTTGTGSVKDDLDDAFSSLGLNSSHMEDTIEQDLL